MSRCLSTSLIGFPRIRALPAVGKISRISSLIVVDLPAPFGPINPNTSPVFTCIFSPSSEVLFLNLKKRTSLEGLNMQVKTGEVFGFIGPNGAGKSTTIKLLMRLIFPTAGSARILGKPISDVEMHRDIGYLPEQPYFYDYLTAAEVLDYFARFHDLTAA